MCVCPYRYGFNFNVGHRVWFDDVPATTTFRCKELLLCKPPPLSMFSDVTEENQYMPKTVMLMIGNSDGIIYKLDQTYTYHVDPLILLTASHLPARSWSGDVSADGESSR